MTDETPSTDPQRRRFTGLTRRKTSSKVRVIDRVARWVIAVGGIGTIVAVLLVCVFLVSVAIPLFRSARTDSERTIAAGKSDSPPLQMGVDEFRLLGWTLSVDGQLQGFKLHDGQPLGEPQAIRSEDNDQAAAMTCCAVAIDFKCKKSFEDLPNGTAKVCMFGFADGSVRLGAIGYKTTFLDDSAVDPAIRALKVADEALEFQGGMVQRTPTGQLRLQQLVKMLDPRTPPVSDSPIEQIDFSLRVEGENAQPIFVARSANGNITLNAVKKRLNLITDESTITVNSSSVPLPTGVSGKPLRTLISGDGDNLFLLWKDGTLVRYEMAESEPPQQVERISLLPRGVELSAATMVLGKRTIMVGDSAGGMSTWCRVNEMDSTRTHLEKTHEIHGLNSPITALCCSPQSRAMAVGDAAGNVQVVYDTSERVLSRVAAQGGSAIRTLLISPKEDELLADNQAGITRWDLDIAHPEVSLRTLVRPVWYESAPQSSHVWQTTGSTDDFEPKFGLWPLIFGTLKATFYSLLFGVPLALMAAVFTSEFLHPSVRARVKPMVETMASLPSVVLGFLAGIVIAPVMETIVPASIAAIVTVPLAFMLGAYLWQLLPIHLAIQYRRFRFACMLLLLPLGLLLAKYLGPSIEQRMFGGDLRLWLSRPEIGSGTPGWAIILLPLSAAVTFLLISLIVHPLLRNVSRGWTRTQAALVDLLKFVSGICITLVLALILGWMLTIIGFDPRGSHAGSSWALVGTYVQRNALIVGFMMGFAIIPIIYTLADDALNTVPSHLRSASLAAGATPWQTLVRIVIPTAMSGLFSAVMIGLGRAVGETMIVLMAAGSTPIMDMNIFNGFRTLSASIAIEMPEAARGTTHYRILFLAALVLFAMTFVVNTAAEVIRQRFRRRAYEL